MDIEQAKIQERMDMYARQDQQRAERKSLLNKIKSYWLTFFFLTEIADDEKERLLKDNQRLRDHWQEQVDRKQREVK